MQHIDLKLYLTFIQTVGTKFVHNNFLNYSWIQHGFLIAYNLWPHYAVCRFKVEYIKLLYTG